MIINHLNSHINITTSLNGFHTEASNRYLANFQLADYQCALSMKNPLTFTGKELDSETGYSYFGARYYDAELSGLFFSVDPMADKYPNISPYAYCAWNPVKLVDPEGLTPRIYVETKGIGHAFVSVEIEGELIVYTYGRYLGGDKNKSAFNSLDPIGKGVLIRLTGEDAKNYIRDKVERMDASVYEFSDASDEIVMQYYEDLFSSGTKLNDKEAQLYNNNPRNYGVSDDARVIDQYSILSNNCVTKSTTGIIKGGSKIRFTKETVYYPEVSESPIFNPTELKSFLDMQSKNNPNVTKISMTFIDAISGAN